MHTRKRQAARSKQLNRKITAEAKLVPVEIPEDKLLDFCKKSVDENKLES